MASWKKVKEMHVVAPSSPATRAEMEREMMALRSRAKEDQERVELMDMLEKEVITLRDERVEMVRVMEEKDHKIRDLSIKHQIMERKNQDIEDLSTARQTELDDIMANCRKVEQTLKDNDAAWAKKAVMAEVPPISALYEKRPYQHM